MIGCENRADSQQYVILHQQFMCIVICQALAYWLQNLHKRTDIDSNIEKVQAHLCSRHWRLYSSTIFWKRVTVKRPLSASSYISLKTDRTNAIIQMAPQTTTKTPYSAGFGMMSVRAQVKASRECIFVTIVCLEIKLRRRRKRKLYLMSIDVVIKTLATGAIS